MHIVASSTQQPFAEGVVMKIVSIALHWPVKKINFKAVTICTSISLPSCSVSSFVLHLLSPSTLKITDEVGRDRLGSQMGEG